MKPLFIMIKNGSEIVSLINSQDIKHVVIKDNQVTLRTSHNEASMRMTDWSIGKLRDELKSRYAIVKIGPRGIDRAGYDSYRGSRRSQPKNDLYEVTDDEHRVAFIFPKALKEISGSDKALTIEAVGGLVMNVTTTAEPRYQDLQLVKLAA